MRRSDLLGRACRRVVLPALGVAALIAVAPAQAAFPGRPGPIAYQKYEIDELGFAGGLFAHGPRKRQAPRQLTESPGDDSPSYSPNGRRIVFSGNRDPATMIFRRSSSHIYVMDSDGGNVRQLTSGEFFDSNPSFSPNGKLIVFDRRDDRRELRGRASQIFSIGVDGSSLRQITNALSQNRDPVFTQNGRRIVFVSNRRTSGRRDRSNIFSMRPNGSHVRLLIGGPRSEFDPDPSPNGRRIAFASNRRHGPNIFIARINGRHVRALTHSRGDCFSGACYDSPSWAPDGRHIAFLSSGRYSTRIEVMRADGRGHSKDFDGGGTEAEGYGSQVGAPGWGPRPR